MGEFGGDPVKRSGKGVMVFGNKTSVYFGEWH